MSQFPDRYVDSGYGWMPNSYASAVRQGDPIWLNWVNTVYREALMGVDFDYMKASYKKWFGIDVPTPKVGFPRSEEHTSELQSLMRISYAVFCLKKKNNQQPKQMTSQTSKPIESQPNDMICIQYNAPQPH